MNRLFRSIASLPATLLLLSASPSAAGQHPAYAIQVGAFAEKTNADAVIASLERHNFKAFQVRNAKGLHVVLSGAYTTREEALADAARLAAGRLIAGYLVLPFQGGASASGRRPEQAKGRRQAPQKGLPVRQKTPGTDKGGSTSTVRTAYAATTTVERAAEAVVAPASQTASGHLQAHAEVFQGGGPETMLATSQPEGTVEQREHGGRVYAALEGAPVPEQPLRAARSRQATAAVAPGTGGLAAAWKQYGAGRIGAAASLFASLRLHPDTTLEAGYGLVRCHLAGNDFAKALPELEHLVKRRYRTRDTLPELLKVLLELREFQKAAGYASLLGEKERAVWQRRIDEGVFLQKYARLRERGGVAETVAFVKEQENVLRQCGMPESFRSLAAYLARNARPADAAAIYGTLFSCTKDEGLQLGTLYDLKPLLPEEELLKLAAQKMGAGSATPAHRAKLETFTVEVLRGLLADDPEQLEKHALALLKMRPGDRDALAALGWWYFDRERYQEAYDTFRKSRAGASKRPEQAEGMVHALIKLDRLDEALEVAGKSGGDPKIALLVEEIQLKMLWNRLATMPPDSPKIEALARRMLQVRPDDREVRVVLAWSHYNRGDFESAHREFDALYAGDRLVKGYAYGLASSLAKLKRYDEAAAIASDNKEHDERLAAFETGIYGERSRSAYEREEYEEAERYLEKLVVADPDDEESKALLESSRYRKTFIAKALAPIVGLSGHSYGNLSHDLRGTNGSNGSVLVQQGIDWVRLPWDVLLRTYGEAWYRGRTWDAQYYDLAGQSAGVELHKSAFKLGFEYAWERYTRQDKSNQGPLLFLGWYRDWYKYMHDESDDAGWFNIRSFSGSTNGRVSQVLGGSTGTTVSGSINQGIDWLTLPGNIMLNTFAEYRFSLRTRDNLYYNAHGPAAGVELQKPPFKAGIEYYREDNPERHLVIPRTSLYLRWYFDWDLKPGK